MFDAVIFDLDGTLVDTEAVALDLGRRCLMSMGHEPDDQVFHQMIGKDGPTSDAILLAAYPALDLPALARSWTRGGFLLLSAGLITGALWAVFAWSDYWSWDPKEGWGLATWLVYAAVLHLHHARERSTRLALAAGLLGWGLVAFTFFGMQLLPTRAQSLHVYEAPPGR